MTKLIRTLDEMFKVRASIEPSSIGFVPTMGNLHEGHLTMMRQSILENDTTVVSLFINPIQFDREEDLIKYPRTFDEDMAKLESLQVAWVFAPDKALLYPDDTQYRIDELSHHEHACGRTRPGHLSGSMTVCMKLFNIVRPSKAYFGEKDYQQWQLMRGMVEAFFLPVEIVGVPTVREETGLALNSRNNRFDKDSRRKAGEFYQILNQGGPIETIADKLKQAGFDPDYVEDLDDRRLAAVWLNEIRLMDNVVLEN